MKDPTSTELQTLALLTCPSFQARSTNLYTKHPCTYSPLPHPPDASTTKCPSFTFLLSRALTPGSVPLSHRRKDSSLNSAPLLPRLKDFFLNSKRIISPFPQHRGIGHIATRRAEVRTPLSSWFFSGHGCGCGTRYRCEWCSETCDFQIRIRVPLHQAA